MSSKIHPKDLSFFSTLVRHGSMTSAARELNLTTAAVSKHLTQMESSLGLALFTRNTRRMSLTTDGETYLRYARNILAQMDDLEQELTSVKAKPRGLLRVNATLGFGRSQIAPIVSLFVQRFPEVEVSLQLSVDPPSLNEDAFDVCIRFGPPQDARIKAIKLVSNKRILCAAPAYLSKFGIPKIPSDLQQHHLISIRQGDDAYGIVRLSKSRKRHPAAEPHEVARQRVWENIKVRGPLTTNDGGIAVQWALDGLGIVMRAQWDVHADLAHGRLVQVLQQYETPNADIYAIYPAQHQATARVREFVQFTQSSLSHRENPPVT